MSIHRTAHTPEPHHASAASADMPTPAPSAKAPVLAQTSTSAATAIRALTATAVILGFVAVAATLRPFATTASTPFAEEPPPAAPVESPEPPTPSIGTITGYIPEGPLEGRTVTIEMFAADEEPLYSAVLSNGETLATYATKYELDAAVPGFDLDDLRATSVGIVDVPID